MFTGIIEHQGIVESLDRAPHGGRLRVRLSTPMPTLKISGSIAVNGCCLTVVQRSADTFAADLSPETLRRTTFGEMKRGASVNLERPLTAGEELGGHLVQGHVDAVGRIVKWSSEGPASAALEEQNWILGVSIPNEIAAYIAEKGSLTVDGISLTVATWRNGIAEFAIIPYTYAHTNLRGAALGDGVNLEADVIAKYVERLLDARRGQDSPRITIERLVEEGF